MFDLVRDYFSQADWPARQAEDMAVLELDYTGKNGQWRCFVRVREQQQQCAVYSIPALHVPEDRRLVAAELLMRLNWGLAIGNFELDLDDGEVRYKTSIDVEGDRLSHALLARLVAANVETFERYLPAIGSVVLLNTPMAEAIAAADRDA
jgi:hypothetical protein